MEESGRMDDHSAKLDQGVDSPPHVGQTGQPSNRTCIFKCDKMIVPLKVKYDMLKNKEVGYIKKFILKKLAFPDGLPRKCTYSCKGKQISEFLIISELPLDDEIVIDVVVTNEIEEIPEAIDDGSSNSRVSTDKSKDSTHDEPRTPAGMSDSSLSSIPSLPVSASSPVPVAPTPEALELAARDLAKEQAHKKVINAFQRNLLKDAFDIIRNECLDNNDLEILTIVRDHKQKLVTLMDNRSIFVELHELLIHYLGNANKDLIRAIVTWYNADIEHIKTKDKPAACGTMLRCMQQYPDSKDIVSLAFDTIYKLFLINDVVPEQYTLCLSGIQLQYNVFTLHISSDPITDSFLRILCLIAEKSQRLAQSLVDQFARHDLCNVLLALFLDTSNKTFQELIIHVFEFFVLDSVQTKRLTSKPHLDRLLQSRLTGKRAEVVMVTNIVHLLSVLSLSDELRQHIMVSNILEQLESMINKNPTNYELNKYAFTTVENMATNNEYCLYLINVKVKDMFEVVYSVRNEQQMASILPIPLRATAKLCQHSPICRELCCEVSTLLQIVESCETDPLVIAPICDIAHYMNLCQLGREALIDSDFQFKLQSISGSLSGEVADACLRVAAEIESGDELASETLDRVIPQVITDKISVDQVQVQRRDPSHQRLTSTRSRRNKQFFEGSGPAPNNGDSSPARDLSSISLANVALGDDVIEPISSGDSPARRDGKDLYSYLLNGMIGSANEKQCEKYLQCLSTLLAPDTFDAVYAYVDMTMFPRVLSYVMQRFQDNAALHKQGINIILLITEKHNLDIIVNSGDTLEVLNKSLSNFALHSDIIEPTVKILANLSAHDEYKQRVVKSSTLTMLAHTIDTTHSEIIHTYANRTLVNLGEGDPQNKPFPAQDLEDSIMDVALRTLQSADDKQCKFVISVLSELFFSGYTVMAKYFFSKKGLDIVLDMMRRYSEDSTVISLSLLLLKYLTNEQNLPMLEGENNLIPACTLVVQRYERDSNCMDNVLLILRNLCKLPTTSVNIVPQLRVLISYFTSQATSANRNEIHLVHLCEIFAIVANNSVDVKQQLIRFGIVKYLSDLLCNESVQLPLLLACCSLLYLLADSDNISSTTVTALVNIARSNMNRGGNIAPNLICKALCLAGKIGSLSSSALSRFMDHKLFSLISEIMNVNITNIKVTEHCVSCLGLLSQCSGVSDEITSSGILKAFVKTLQDCQRKLVDYSGNVVGINERYVETLCSTVYHLIVCSSLCQKDLLDSNVIDVLLAAIQRFPRDQYIVTFVITSLFELSCTSKGLSTMRGIPKDAFQILINIHEQHHQFDISRIMHIKNETMAKVNEYTSGSMEDWLSRASVIDNGEGLHTRTWVNSELSESDKLKQFQLFYLDLAGDENVTPESLLGLRLETLLFVLDLLPVEIMNNSQLADDQLSSFSATSSTVTASNQDVSAAVVGDQEGSKASSSHSPVSTSTPIAQSTQTRSRESPKRMEQEDRHSPSTISPKKIGVATDIVNESVLAREIDNIGSEQVDPNVLARHLSAVIEMDEISRKSSPLHDSSARFLPPTYVAGQMEPGGGGGGVSTATDGSRSPTTSMTSTATSTSPVKESSSSLGNAENRSSATPSLSPVSSSARKAGRQNIPSLRKILTRTELALNSNDLVVLKRLLQVLDAVAPSEIVQTELIRLGFPRLISRILLKQTDPDIVHLSLKLCTQLAVENQLRSEHLDSSFFTRLSQVLVSVNQNNLTLILHLALSLASMEDSILAGNLYSSGLVSAICNACCSFAENKSIMEDLMELLLLNVFSDSPEKIAGDVRNLVDRILMKVIKRVWLLEKLEVLHCLSTGTSIFADPKRSSVLPKPLLQQSFDEYKQLFVTEHGFVQACKRAVLITSIPSYREEFLKLHMLVSFHTAFQSIQPSQEPTKQAYALLTTSILSETRPLPGSLITRDVFNDLLIFARYCDVDTVSEVLLILSDFFSTVGRWRLTRDSSLSKQIPDMLPVPPPLPPPPLPSPSARLPLSPPPVPAPIMKMPSLQIPVTKPGLLNIPPPPASPHKPTPPPPLIVPESPSGGSGGGGSASGSDGKASEESDLSLYLNQIEFMPPASPVIMLNLSILSNALNRIPSSLYDRVCSCIMSEVYRGYEFPDVVAWIQSVILNDTISAPIQKAYSNAIPKCLVQILSRTCYKNSHQTTATLLIANFVTNEVRSNAMLEGGLLSCMQPLLINPDVTDQSIIALTRSVLIVSKFVVSWSEHKDLMQVLQRLESRMPPSMSDSMINKLLRRLMSSGQLSDEKPGSQQDSAPGSHVRNNSMVGVPPARPPPPLPPHLLS